MNQVLDFPVAIRGTETPACAPVILHVFSTFAIGGPQRRFAQLAHHFGRRYRHIIKPMDGRTDARELLAGTDSWEIQLLGFARGSTLDTIKGARRELDVLKPDLLVTYNWGAMEWAAANLFCGVRHVHIEDGFGPEEANGQLLRRVLFRRLVLNRRSTLVLPSHRLMHIARQTWRIKPRRIRYVPNGIPCARFHLPADPVVTQTFRGVGPVVGTVATLRREKALDRLISAFAQVKANQQARLVIVGDGPVRPALEQQVASLGLLDCVTFTGNLTRPEAALGGFDVFAISSDTEQMPLSVLEAMAAGLPIASTDVGDIRLMVSEENLPYVVPKDPTALGVAIGLLLKDAQLPRHVGQANQARAEAEYDEATMFARYDNLFSGQSS